MEAIATSLDKVLCEDVKITWQFFEQGQWFNLNCGRFCAEAALDWCERHRKTSIAAQAYLGESKTTVTELLEEQGYERYRRLWPKNAFGSWAPDKEGGEYFERVLIPGTVRGWVTLINDRGPVIAAIPGHYILIIGADSIANRLFLKDPLNPLKFVKGDREYDKLIQEINEIFAVRKHKRTNPTAAIFGYVIEEDAKLRANDSSKKVIRPLTYFERVEILDIARDGSVFSLGVFSSKEDHYWVKTGNGQEGWMRKEAVKVS